MLSLFFKTIFFSDWWIVFAGVFLVNAFIAFNYYFFILRGGRKITKIICILFHIILFFITLIYFCLYFNGKTEGTLILKYITGFSLSLSLFLGIIFFILDIFIWVVKRDFRRRIFISAIIVCTVFSLLSFISPENIVITNYTVKEDSFPKMKIAFISDLHIGVSIKDKEILEIKEKIEAEKPDLIAFGGDIFDEGTTEREKEFFCKTLGSLYSKYGSYAIIGNHDEYLLGEKTFEEYFRGTNIKVLIDETNIIDNKFILVGRDDAYQKRKSLLELLSPYDSDGMDKVDSNLPIIILDHQPKVNELKEINSPFIQLSGHTHNGQILPFSLATFVTKKYYYGEHKIGKGEIIISSGVGTYGIPNRLFTKSEIEIVELGE